MEDSNSPQTKGEGILLVMCVLFLNWCMFHWKCCEELSSRLVKLSCCQSYHGDSSGLCWEVWFSLNSQLWFAGVLSFALGLAVSLPGCDVWFCLCRYSAPGLPFGVKASQSCRELLCPPQVKCPTLHLWGCLAGLLECFIQCYCFHSHIICFVFHTYCILLWCSKEFWIIEVWKLVWSLFLTSADVIWRKL